MRRPVFFVALAFLCGSCLGRYFFISGGWLAALAAGCLVAALAYYKRGHGAEGRLYLERAWYLLLLIFVLLAFYQSNAVTRQERLSDRQVRLLEKGASRLYSGIVAGEPSLRHESERMIVDVKDVRLADAGDKRLASRVRLSLVRDCWDAQKDAPPFQGETVVFRGRLHLPDASDSWSLFDYKAFLRGRGIGAVMTLWQSRDFVVKGGDSLEVAFFSRLMQWRRVVLERLRLNLDPEPAGVARAMLFGETGGVSREVRQSFVHTGAGHLFAVSGLHTAMLALLIFGLLRLVGFRARIAAGVLVVALVLYCLLVGFRAPVLRGTIMAICLTLPVFMRRPVDQLNSLALAVVLVLFFNPAAIIRTDFQFSYTCALGIVTLGPALRELLCYDQDGLGLRQRRWAYLWNTTVGNGIALVVAAQITLLPLISIYFHVFSLVGFLSNLLLVPLGWLVLLFAWLYSLLGPIHGFFGDPLLFLLSQSLAFLTGLAGFFKSLPFSSMPISAFPWWAILLYYVGLFTGPEMFLRRGPGDREKRRAWLVLKLAAIVTLLIWWPILERVPIGQSPASGSFRLTMLDVGQGDCLVIRSRSGQVLVVDAGKRGAGEILVNYLASVGVDEVDTLLLTHSDADHIGGAPTLLRRVYVEKIVEGPGSADTRLRDELDALVAELGVPVIRCARGYQMTGMEGVRVEVLSPRDMAHIPGDRNNASLVLLVEYGEATFLLTGDAEDEAEREMLRVFGAAALQAEVLKVAHHGSHGASSAAFLDAVQPAVALISAGRRNQYGHPAPATIQRLLERGATLYSTAVQGSVDIATDGTRLWVRVQRAPESD